MYAVKNSRLLLVLASVVIAFAVWVFAPSQSLQHEASVSDRTSRLATGSVSPASPDDRSTDLLADQRASSTSDMATNAGNRDEAVASENFGRRFDALLSQSKSGDNSAKIALAVGMEYCSTRQSSHASYLAIKHQVDELTEKYAREGRTEPSVGFRSLVSSADAMKSNYERIASDCAGIADEDLKQRWKFQLEAAKTGNEDAVMDFLEHPAIDPAEAFADDSAINAFRTHASSLLERQLSERSVRAHKAYVRAGYDALMKPRQRFHAALSMVIEPDPVQILAFDTALARAGVPGFGRGPNFEAMHQRVLDPVQVMEAEALAQRLWPTLTPKGS